MPAGRRPTKAFFRERPGIGRGPRTAGTHPFARGHRRLHARHDDDLSGRHGGEPGRPQRRARLVTATLEVAGGQARLTDIVHVGAAPLAGNTNEIAIATGLLAVGDEVPDAAFIDQTDRRRSFAEWKGMPDAGQLRLHHAARCRTSARSWIRTSRPSRTRSPKTAHLRGKVKLVSISVDPDHDTPAVLAAHAARRTVRPGRLDVADG